MNLVNPGYTGLTTADGDAGDVRRRHPLGASATRSVPGYDNPSPNAGIYNPLQPQILMIPRRPTNLFYNVSTPDQWVAEYNDIYRSFWGRDLSYAEILDHESDVLRAVPAQGRERSLDVPPARPAHLRLGAAACSAICWIRRSRSTAAG